MSVLCVQSVVVCLVCEPVLGTVKAVHSVSKSRPLIINQTLSCLAPLLIYGRSQEETQL